MFESDEEYEGILFDENIIVVSQQIVSYFKSPSEYNFSDVNESDKRYANEKNTDKNIVVIDNKDTEN